jgi:hypothetical protein
MAKRLSTIPQNALAVPLNDGAVDAILFSAQQFATRQGGILQLQNMPTESERGLLLSRLNALRLSMECDREASGAAIATMLAGFPNAVKPNETAEQVAAWYVQELELPPAVPTWAVERACLDIRKGQAADIGPRTYPRPSTLAVRKLADAYAYKARCEINSITDVLRGRQADPVLTPEERAKLKLRWRGFADEMIARNCGAGVVAHEVSELEAMVGAETFQSLPDQPKREHGGSIGRLAAKVAG